MWAKRTKSQNLVWQLCLERAIISFDAIVAPNCCLLYTSPFVEKVTVVRKGKVRRAKLFYLRGRTGKAAKVKSDI